MTKQLAVKLPDALVEEIDRLIEGGTFDNRSHAIRSGLEAMVVTGRRKEIDRRYRDAASRLPETKDEMEDATHLAINAINEEPWERWW